MLRVLAFALLAVALARPSNEYLRRQEALHFKDLSARHQEIIRSINQDSTSKFVCVSFLVELATRSSLSAL
jgi:ABC-type antimicrobial peptide transport system ATPase subunit